MKTFEILKDIYVSSGPPIILLKGAKVRFCFAKGAPVLGCIFEDRETQQYVNRENWKEYLRLID